MGNNIAAGELSKDVDGAEQIIKERNERKVWMANNYYFMYTMYIRMYVCTLNSTV